MVTDDFRDSGASAAPVSTPGGGDLSAAAILAALIARIRSKNAAALTDMALPI